MMYTIVTVMSIAWTVAAYAWLDKNHERIISRKNMWYDMLIVAPIIIPLNIINKFIEQ